MNRYSRNGVPSYPALPFKYIFPLSGPRNSLKIYLKHASEKHSLFQFSTFSARWRTHARTRRERKPLCWKSKLDAGVHEKNKITTEESSLPLSRRNHPSRQIALSSPEISSPSPSNPQTRVGGKSTRFRFHSPSMKREIKKLGKQLSR